LVSIVPEAARGSAAMVTATSGVHVLVFIFSFLVDYWFGLKALIATETESQERRKKESASADYFENESLSGFPTYLESRTEHFKLLMRHNLE
jgi:hypothetical protein